MAPSDYENALALIGEIEGTSKKTEVSYINLSELVNESEKSKIGYTDALQLISEVESGGRRFRERAAQPTPSVAFPQPARQIPAPTPAPVSRPAPAQKEKVKKPERGGFGFMGTQKKVQPPPVEAQAQRREAAAAELGSVATKLQAAKPVQFPELKLKKKVNMKELVLPSLSIADQVSELERIIEGVRENVFDEEQYDIVLQEVYGMERVVEQDRKRLKGKPPTDNELELSLYEVRDQRLLEAATLLKQQEKAR
jgi:hypothetical protein